MKQRYRYPGVRPFEAADSALFFGRDRDCSDLLGLIALEKLVVLFGKSGYGKSSLINAAVIPLLERKGSAAISIRFGSYSGGQEPLSTFLLNRMESDKRMSVNADMKFLDGICPDKSLWYQAKLRQNKNTRWIFFFDQFEEYFQHPAGLRRNFEEQLAELLYTDVPQTVLNNSLDCNDDEMSLLVLPLDIRVVFSIRGDRLSELDSMKNRLPAILQKRFELAALNQGQARDAIEKPASLTDPEFISPPFEYTQKALERMLSGLTGSKGGIEAFQLQILCDYIDNKVSEGTVPDRDNNNLPDVDVDDLPDLELVYLQYYSRRLSHLRTPELIIAARHIIEDELIFENKQTGEARRLSVDKDVLLQQAGPYGATESLLNELENTFLLRRETNSVGGFNYEISHDTLLAPMLKAKQDRLFKEWEATTERERVLAIERASKAEQDAKNESLRRRKATFLAVAASILFLVAAVLGLFALRATNSAQAALKEAVRAQVAKRKAENKNMQTEIETARSKAKNILERANTLRVEYPATHDKLRDDAQKLLQDMLLKYPGDTTLKIALNNLNH